MGIAWEGRRSPCCHQLGKTQYDASTMCRPLESTAVSRQQAQKKSCWDFVHALLELAVWFQAGEDRAIAAGSKSD
jgi:hypothetical protein